MPVIARMKRLIVMTVLIVFLFEKIVKAHICGFYMKWMNASAVNRGKAEEKKIRE